MNVTIKMAIKSITTKKGRSFLTMLGIIIGIAAVMTIVSVVSGYNTKMMERFNSMGTNKVTVYGYMYNGESMFDKIYSYCQTLEEVAGVTPIGSVGGTVKHGTKNSNNMEYPPQIFLGSDQYSICNKFEIERGRDICKMDIEEFKQVIVLGARAAKNFFDYSDPLGQTVSINGTPYQVIGIYAEKDPESRWSLDNIMVLPYSCSRYFVVLHEMSEFSVKVREADKINSVVTLISGYMTAITKNRTIGDGYCYSESAWQSHANAELNMISLVLGGIAGISLLVGGIGIMNIMLVTVTERTKEIGIRRAIGAKRRVIVIQFLMEAAMLCGFGGIIGIALGYGLTNIAGRLIFNGMSLLPTFSITLSAFAFSVAIGIIFGMYPAVKASRLQPVVALRAE